MTVLLYSYKDDGADGLDLRMSLRSIERHLHLPIEDVVVVGDRLEWFKGHYIPRTQSPDVSGHVNVLRNVYMACSILENGTPEAIYLDDDYLLLDHVETVPLMHRGPIGEHLRDVRRSKPRGHWYREAFEDSVEALQGHPNPLSWELHRPMPIVPLSAAEVLQQWLNRPLFQPFWRMMVGNLAEKPDVPVYRGLDVRGERTPPYGSAWVSSDNDRAGAWLYRAHERFTAPSRWEA